MFCADKHQAQLPEFGKDVAGYYRMLAEATLKQNQLPLSCDRSFGLKFCCCCCCCSSTAVKLQLSFAQICEKL